MKKIIYFSIIAVLVGFFVVQKVTAQKSENNRLSVSEFKKALEQDNIQVVDVRTIKEYKAGSIYKAIHMDVLQQNNFKEQIATLNKEMPTYIYCHAGVRSLRALKIMSKSGFTKVYDLKKGFVAWKKTNRVHQKLLKN